MPEDHLKWGEWLEHAYAVARNYSTDPSTQNGALLINNYGAILVTAANHFPYGVVENGARWKRPTKYLYVEHAERNVLYAAARIGICTQGLTMVCPWFACADCARGIIQAGIKLVIGHASPLHKMASPEWQETIRHAESMLQEGGVRFVRIPWSFPNVTIRFNGQEQTP